MYGRGGHAWQGVCVAGGHAWQGGMCGREGLRGRRDRHCSGRYASYRNAFLFMATVPANFHFLIGEKESLTYPTTYSNILFPSTARGNVLSKSTRALQERQPKIDPFQGLER